MIRQKIKEWERLCREPRLMLAIIVSCYLLFVFILFPLLKVIGASLYDGKIFTLKNYFDFWTTSYLLTPFINSIHLGLWVGSLGTFFGFITAYGVVKGGIPFKKTYGTLATIPIVAPPFMVALASILIFGNNGYLTRWIFGDKPMFSIYGLTGLVIVETLAYFPTAFLVLKGTLEALSASFEEASLDLGADRLQTFWRITLPLAIPGIASSFLLIFIESLAAVT